MNKLDLAQSQIFPLLSTIIASKKFLLILFLANTFSNLFKSLIPELEDFVALILDAVSRTPFLKISYLFLLKSIFNKILVGFIPSLKS